MRPLPGDDAFGHQRSADCDGLAPANSSTNNHMSFFLADEATVDSYLEQSSTGGSRSRNTKKVADKGYVVSAGREENMPGPSRSTSRDSLLDYGSAYSPLSTASFPSPTPVPTSSRSRAPLSRPITPITLGTSVTGSLVSSPSSERDSPVGSISEHAVSWDENEHIVEAAGHDMVDSGSAPQLVMPSIKMPSRRPFTETGKSLDRLRIMIAGRSGVGKTSLVKAIVQSCEHIVHVDPIGPHAGARISSKATARPVTSRRRSSDSTHSICEIFASTKPYPEWWTELDDLPAGQKRKSLGDHVLDRNICFVDTPGYGVGSSVSILRPIRCALLTYLVDGNHRALYGICRVSLEQSIDKCAE